MDGDIILVSAKPGNKDPWIKQINLEVKDMPLSQVLENLLKDRGISYTIDPSIGDIKVTAVLRNVHLESALRQVVKGAGIVYRVDGNIYMFAPKPAVTAAPTAPPPDLPDGRIEKIPLNWIEGW